MNLIAGILGAAGQPIVAIGQCLWVPLRRQIGYIKNLEENFEKLKGKVIELYIKREDVNREINRDTISKMPTTECQAWLQKVGDMENEVNAMETEFRENKRCCIGGLCPDILWRRKLCKKIVEMIDDIVNLNLKGDSMFSGTYIVDVPRQSVEPIPAPTIQGNTPINRTVQKILRCLRDDDNKQKIGIWGMGGVGKTTTMKAINNSPKISSMFEMVIWVTVSKDGDIRKVQKDVIERLSLKFDDNESVGRTAMKIFQRLSNMKNYLVLLDDLWEKMELEDIGIPNPSRENGCKLIITTRSMRVCDKMEIDEAIKVEVLSEEEAWNLFRKKVGNVVDSHDIREIATQVVRKCKGLPLAIIVIGGALRNKKDLSEWRNALKELRSNQYEIIADMEKSVFKLLKFSYDQLERNNIKKCFLYCALYPEDYEIGVTELIQHWWAEGLIDGDLSLDEAYDRGHAIVNYLKDVSLLEGVDLPWNVKMHDVIRDLALTITSSESLFSSTMVVPEDGNQFLVRTNYMGLIKELSSSNDQVDWGQFQRISLMRSKIHNLPENPTSLLLETLFLRDNRSLSGIPESFFEHMHNLRVLDLSETDIRELPSSVSRLVNLGGLFLLDCPYLVTLPSEIGNLKKLRLLHIGVKGRGNFECLPSEIRQLTLLRSLEVTFNKIPISGFQELMLPNGIIPTLSLLENLRICIGCNLSPKLVKTIAQEVGSLKELTAFEFRSETLESFGCWWEKLNKLKRCVVSGCNIFDGNHDHLSSTSTSTATCSAVLPNLGHLTVRDMPSIGAIWESPMPPGSFSRLASLTILYCKNMRQIFTRGILQQLSNLEKLFVSRCHNLQVIVNEKEEEEEGHNDDVAFFPKLKILFLCDLPRLERIWKTVCFPMAPLLEKIRVLECPNLKSLPYFSLGIQQNASSSTTTLRRIEGSAQWWEALEWEHDEIKQQLQPLLHLY
ncbi:disease resistance protein SUMM2-like [Macadamia integrifolia]|uniref:disease resistance protein SUMM2-like n=1 Tax=Macadamia integrifolia TaxID=60698 RepID=UPI001C4F69ED|nr:disease resistance protein SUMM2-like [Macadamia integrifolia]XP_042514863.1 disease resistance protein SUMM2-like [Macadamia integrifolia]XP_042514864.1 disease resistance protein SUMM2-like [Macadamia integrifolia]XP_042514865.1 disease resistance protein SUMM2-like [Macadamia integrifolia]XP_042514866.1 disease resistance protein SUMM2-like [Macadamia integrifolia]XP_042514867.1 disease resistance protein SUMM2-like [Macadamia integrifolia]XP_042514868.1 disease resistance protein SUMM2